MAATRRARRGYASLEYRIGYCVQVTEFLGRGYSLSAFAGEIGTTRANLLDWCVEHSPFADAVARGQARRARLLEESLSKADPSGRAALLRALKDAAPEDWAPRRRGGGVPKPAPPPPRRAKSAPEERGEPTAFVALPDNGRG